MVMIDLNNGILGIDPKKGLVNWNGSSYSGADIKLVVHTSANEIATQAQSQEALTLDSSINTLQNEADAATDPKTRAALLAGIDVQLAQKTEVLNQPIPASHVVIATAQTLSVQTFRAKKPVRALGCVGPKGIARGSRSIGGSIIFTVFDEHALTALLHTPPTIHSHELINSRGGFKTYVDQLPPLTITALLSNEYGSISELTIYGVDFVTDGQVMSIDDLFSENTCSFMATDFDLLQKKAQVDLRKSAPGSKTFSAHPTSASSLLDNADYRDYQTKLGVQRDPYS